MHRFFVENAADGAVVALPADSAAHIERVLRLTAGERVLLLNGCGRAFVAELVHVSAAAAQARCLEEVDVKSEPRVRVTLFQGLPKGDKMEDIVRKCVEIGAVEIVRFAAARSVARPDAKAAKSKVERWRKIARSAAEQSQRGIIPPVSDILSFPDALARMAAMDRLIVPWEEERATPFAAALRGLSGGDAIALVIGPEGGLAADEVDEMRSSGASTVTLGARILRTETAGMAALSALLFAAGEWGGV